MTRRSLLLGTPSVAFGKDWFSHGWKDNDTAIQFIQRERDYLIAVATEVKPYPTHAFIEVWARGGTEGAPWETSATELNGVRELYENGEPMMDLRYQFAMAPIVSNFFFGPSFSGFTIDPKRIHFLRVSVMSLRGERHFLP